MKYKRLESDYSYFLEKSYIIGTRLWELWQQRYSIYFQHNKLANKNTRYVVSALYDISRDVIIDYEKHKLCECPFQHLQVNTPHCVDLGEFSNENEYNEFFKELYGIYDGIVDLNVSNKFPKNMTKYLHTAEQKMMELIYSLANDIICIDNSGCPFYESVGK